MIRRELERVALRYSEGFKVLGIVGPRQSGKTTLARNLFPDKPYVSLENPDAQQFALDDPQGFLDQNPDEAVLDEVQRCPELFSYIQGRVDESNKAGMYVLTGSQQFGLMENITQSLAGRIGMLKLLPFGYSELLAGGVAEETPEKALFKGCYPPLYDQKVGICDWLNSYISTYVERDVRQIVNIRELARFRQFLSLCAGSAGQLFNATRLATDCGVSRNTIQSWVNILEAAFIVFRLHPHHENHRKRIVKTPKLYFYDTGLLIRLLEVQSSDQLWTHPLRGAWFENWVISEVMKSLRHAGDTRLPYFWRDNTGHEIDLLLEDGAKRHCVKIKSGRTVSTDWFDTIKWWRSLPDSKNGQDIVVYAGAESQSRRQGEVTSWKDVGSSVMDLV